MYSDLTHEPESVMQETVPPARPIPPTTVAPNNDAIMQEMSQTLIGTTRTIMNETYNTAIFGINAGFALAVALAWNETAKKIIKHYVQVKNMTKFHIVYALAITVFAGLVFTITQLFFKPTIKKTEVKPVIAVGLK